MSTAKTYPIIEPGKKRFKTLVTRISFLFLGLGFQTAYVIDPDVKREVDGWPETFTFVFGVDPEGPRMVIQKRNGKVQYLGEQEVFHANIVICLKHIDYAFMMMTGQMSTPHAISENRQYVKGELDVVMSIIRCLNIIQTILFPNFIAKYYIKKVPKLTFRKIVNRIVFYTVGIFGMIK